MAGFQTLAWVDEVVPDVRYLGDDGYGHPTEQRVEFPDDRLTVTMRNRLLRLANEEVDEKGCDAGECFHGVGYCLREDDDNPHRSGIEWLWTTVIEFPDGRTLVVCEECSPTNFYPEA